MVSDDLLYFLDKIGTIDFLNAILELVSGEDGFIFKSDNTIMNHLVKSLTILDEFVNNDINAFDDIYGKDNTAVLKNITMVKLEEFQIDQVETLNKSFLYAYKDDSNQGNWIILIIFEGCLFPIMETNYYLLNVWFGDKDINDLYESFIISETSSEDDIDDSEELDDEESDEEDDIEEYNEENE